MKRASMEEIEVHKGSADVNIFVSQDEMATSLSKYIGDLSEKFVKEKGVFTIVLSGDSYAKTIRNMMEPSSSVDWSKWYVFWVDERVVPKDSSESNYKLAYDEFLSKVPIPDDHIISINDKLLPEAASVEYESRLKQLMKSHVIATSNNTGFPKFDLILLGLGYNGHIASLFPNHPQLKENTTCVTYIMDSPKPPPQRITMTFPVINSASNVAFVVTGEEKARVVYEVFDRHQSLAMLPAKLVSPKGELKWFLDKEAASMINN
uniref:Probable 6-phosphogluconolactonase n=1 Tax=Chenopodium quinoa TaxID=63459 RepID=A0A803L2E4_CHEQI